MLINSKFRDFYDSCAGYGVDTQVVYRRVTEEVVNPRDESSDKFLDPHPEVKAVNEACAGWGPLLGNRWDWETHTRRGKLFASVWVLGLAGNLYKFVNWSQDRISDQGVYAGIDYRSEFLKGNMPEEFMDKFSSFRDTVPLADHFEELQVRSNPDIFVQLDCPLFLGMENKIIKNPRLLDHDLTRLKDGVTLFQEISSFISGTLTTAKQMKHVASDKELIQAHGFDKHSFRKGKTK